MKQQNEWQKLESEAERIQHTTLVDLFAAQKDRVQGMSLDACGLYLDYSKNQVDEASLSSLFDLARAQGFEQQRKQLFSGQVINHTEQRSVAHMALRAFSNTSYSVGGKDVMPLMRQQLSKMRVFVNAVRAGKWRGHTGKPVRSIVNIGIGGSDLGPKMVVEALSPYARNDLSIHYVSNVDSSALHQALAQCDPEQTLFVICSKSFLTAETLSNSQAARQWFLRSGGSTQVLHKHFVAVTTNSAEANKFGIHPDQQFAMWDWVGGRFSLWSSIGLSIALMVGMDRFIELLKGAEEMDQHFLNAPLEKNMPVIMALLGVWYSSFMGAQSHAVIPYDHYLRLFPEFLQQLDMESNGKQVDRQGNAVDYATAPIVWGTAGTNGQHAYFQLLHQGGRLIPSDFILLKESHNPLANNHQQLLASGIAQMEAFMVGKDEKTARKEMKLQGLAQEEIDKLAPYKVFPGNQPSNAIVMDKLTPKRLGSLIALYEHKIFTQGVIWNLNSFDQWGVEYGKQLANQILDELDEDRRVKAVHDDSTRELIRRLLKD